MDKKVLIIAHQFPPVGGSGVQRSTKFVKYLHKYAWNPIVLTRDIKKLRLKDDSLMTDIPQDTKIFRSNAWDLKELPKVLSIFGKVISKIFLVPDGDRLWQLFSRSKAVKIIKDENINLIYTTSYPYSSHLLGLYLKKKFPQIPWVADFRDEWTRNPNVLDFNYNVIRKKIEKGMEDSVLFNADCVVANTPLMMENFIDNRENLRDKFFVISNGYDEEDFDGMPTTIPENKVFTVTYSGLLYGRRKPDLFLEAIGDLLKDKKLDSNKIKINLIGNFRNDIVNSLLNRFGLKDVVNILPYMKHKDSIRQLMQSDALLMIAGKGEDAFYLGKIFEYMRTCRPILAVVPEKGVAADLIRESCTGLVSDSSDIEKIKQNVLELYYNWQKNINTLKPKLDVIERFERRILTKELSKVFKAATENVGKSHTLPMNRKTNKKSTFTQSGSI